MPRFNPKSRTIRNEVERNGIQAVPKPRWSRAIGKDMAEMTFAPSTNNFITDHAMTGIPPHRHVLRVEWLEETRPACAGFKLGGRPEEGQIAQPAMIHPGFFVVQQPAAERGFRPLMEKDSPFLRRQPCRQPVSLDIGKTRHIKPRRGSSGHTGILIRGHHNCSAIGPYYHLT
jgi:hypothetical protein